MTAQLAGKNKFYAMEKTDTIKQTQQKTTNTDNPSM